ncbi:MAG: L-serine ammonia-lyase, iron-sulfur-dependent subunit beta [Clostridia bacterium]|nr:L-serine ammonia-lyase, iron-sulfur-dependent subunit beta [Clostridia bacterium]
MENFSVFDIIGPRMTGPSSSHTAGAVRLGYIARRITGAEISYVKFTLYGSFAETGRGHGTDKALIAGIMGCQPDDPRISSAYKYAREYGIGVDFVYSDEPVDHPNTVRIEVEDVNERKTSIVGRSVGGGNILITEINGMSVEVTGDYPTLIIQHRDMPGVISDVSRVLAQLGVNIAYMKVFRHGRRDADAYMCIESDNPVTPDMQDIIRRLCPAVHDLMVI